MSQNPIDRKLDSVKVCVGLIVLGLGGYMASDCSAQGMPAGGLDPMAATTLQAIADASPEGRALSAAEERDFVKRRAVLDRAFNNNLDQRHSYAEILGRGRCRELDRALFSYNLHSPSFGHDLWQNPDALESSADVVLSAYGKLQREALEDALGIDEWWDRKRPRSSSDDRPRMATERSFRVKASPRLSSDYIGVKMKMPYTGSRTVDFLRFHMRYDLDESRPTFGLRFDDQSKYWNLTYEPGTRTFGDLVSLSVRYVW